MHRAVHQQTVRNPKEGRFPASSNKPQTPQSIYGKTSLQDGGVVQGERLTEEERLDVLDRFEGRISVSTYSRTPQEVPQVHLAGCDI